MNAYLMAAGIATRLRPITEKYPKCLLEVSGISMLDYWLTACLNTNLKVKKFENIFVNVHHCSKTVEIWLSKYKMRAAKHYGQDAVDIIKIIDETSKLLGTAGTLFWHGDSDQDFFLAYVDTYSNAVFKDLPRMVKNWCDNPDNPLAGLITFNLPQDGSAGAIEIDFLGTVKSFNEKDKNGLVGWAGMMFAKGEFINQITREDTDLARHVLPKLCGKIRVLGHVAAYDIGRGLDEYEQFCDTKHA